MFNLAQRSADREKKERRKIIKIKPSRVLRMVVVALEAISLIGNAIRMGGVILRAAPEPDPVTQDITVAAHEFKDDYAGILSLFFSSSILSFFFRFRFLFPVASGFLYSARSNVSSGLSIQTKGN